MKIKSSCWLAVFISASAIMLADSTLRASEAEAEPQPTSTVKTQIKTVKFVANVGGTASKAHDETLVTNTMIVGN